MEAFRLFSNDRTVINNHLNKMDGYDQECLSTVFILVYCDVPYFSELCNNYEKYTCEREYSGFRKSIADNELLKIIKDSATVKTYREVRYRGKKPITIYHIMANLRFSS